MTNRSDISRELELEIHKKKEERKKARQKKEARKFFRMQDYGSPGPGRDFPAPGSDPNIEYYKRKKKKIKGIDVYKGGKIMVGYKAGGKV